MKITCYAITVEKSGDLLSPETIRKFFPNYGGGMDSYWKPPKKVYTELKYARVAFGQLPQQLKDICVIQRLGPVGEVIRYVPPTPKKPKKSSA